MWAGAEPEWSRPPTRRPFRISDPGADRPGESRTHHGPRLGERRRYVRQPHATTCSTHTPSGLCHLSMPPNASVSDRCSGSRGIRSHVPNRRCESARSAQRGGSRLPSVPSARQSWGQSPVKWVPFVEVYVHDRGAASVATSGGCTTWWSQFYKGRSIVRCMRTCAERGRRRRRPSTRTAER